MEKVNQALQLQAEIKAEIQDIQSQIERHQRVEVVNSMIDNCEAEMARLSIDVQALKESVAELASQKAAAVRAVSRVAVSRMSKLLPAGKAVIDIRDDDSVFIGWNNGKRVVPYAGLSGGQKVAFDMALSSALLPEKTKKLLIVEAGELDAENLGLLMDRLDENCPDDTQIICNSCHWVEEIPPNWKAIPIT